MTSEPMTTLDRSFVDGIFWRIVALGAVVAAITALVISVRFGYSVALGALVSAASLRVTTFAVQQLIRRTVDEDRSGGLWAVVLGVKLLALLFVIFICLAVLDAHAVAFVIGFKLILPALGWQAIRNPDHLDGAGDDANDDKESA